MRHKVVSLLAALATTTAVNSQAAEIDFWFGLTGVAGDAVTASCDAFNASQSEHVVNCTSQGSYEELMQKSIAAVRAKEHPALIQFYDAGTLDVMLSGAIMPVQELMPDVDWSDYINGARSYYETSKGELYAQPYNGSTLVFYGNKDMLSKVGVSELPETYEGVIEVAQKLKDAGVECPLLQRVHPWFTLEQFSARHGDAIATQNNGYGGLDAEYVVDKGLVATHLKNIQKWREEGLLKLPDDTPGGKNAFNTGECAMMENSTGAYGGATTALGDVVTLGMAPVYEGTERKNTLIGGGSIWVMKDHDEASYEAAKAFLNFLREDAQQVEFTRATGYMPVTKSGLNAIATSDEAGDPAFATVEVGVGSLDQPSTADSRGVRLGYYSQFRDAYIEEVTKAFNGEQSIDDALSNSVSRGNELLRRFEQTYAGVELP